MSPAADIGGSVAEAERLRREGALSQARQVLGRAVDLASAVAGADPLELCTARRLLGEIMCELGDLQGAHHVLSTLVPEAEKTFGPRHPASVRSLAVLAAVVHELGDFAAAERLYSEVGERIGDQKSRAGSLVRVRLALVQRDRGNLDAARDQLSDAYHKHRDAFGTDDPDTVHIAAQLAEMHRDAGDSATARRVLTVAYVASCSSLGEEHELTRRLECDLEALEAPMPSAPVDLPEDTQSTRAIKRRHSKKGAAAAPPSTGRRATTTGPLPGHTTGPLPGHTTGSLPAGPVSVPPGYTTGPLPAGSVSAPPGHTTGAIPARPGSVTGPIPAPPAGRMPGSPTQGSPSGRMPASPISGAPKAGGPSGVYPQVPPDTAPPHRGPFTSSPRSSATAPPRGPAVYGPPAPAAPPGVYGSRAGQVPAQARRRAVVETDQGYGGRRTSRPNSPHSAPPGHSTYGEPLSSARLAALAAQETVIQHVVVDPVVAPPPATAPRPGRGTSGNGIRIAAVILVVIAILAGITLAVLGVIVAG